MEQQKGDIYNSDDPSLTGYADHDEMGFSMGRSCERMGMDTNFLHVCTYGIGIILLFGCVTTTGADTADYNLLEMQSSGVALIPGHSGEDYSFTGSYENGQITITGPGDYYLTHNLSTASTDYAIQIASPHVTLDGNQIVLTGPGDSGMGINITSSGPYSVAKNFSSVSGFNKGIYSEGNDVVISDSMVHDNKLIGIHSSGNYSKIERNLVFNHEDTGIYSCGHYTDITENYAAVSGNGILSQGNYANLSGNAGNDNSNYGIYAGGSYAGPEPGNQGSGYYARLVNNVAILNSVGGIKTGLPHAIIEDNSVFQNLENGITITPQSRNATIISNYISDNPIGIVVSDQALHVSIIQNLIRTMGNSGIFFDPDEGNGSGVIYDNIFSGEPYINGTGNAGAFLWTKPGGPTPGTSIMDGPYIAGNYWTNPDHTGWSDQQPGDPKGYTTTPYEVSPGVYDTAPLVQTPVTPTPTPTPVPVVPNFTASPVTGVPPLTIQFTDISSGEPDIWRWNFGDGTYSTMKNPVHEYKGIGRYTITLEAENRDYSGIIRKTELIKTIRPKRT